MAEDADKSVDVEFLYSIGEKAFAIFADTKWYPVSIRDRNVDKHPDTGAGSATYLVHYSGWNDRFDEWMLEDCLMKDDEKGKKEAVEENARVQSKKKKAGAAGAHQKSTHKKGTQQVPRSRAKTGQSAGTGLKEATPIPEVKSAVSQASKTDTPAKPAGAAKSKLREAGDAMQLPALALTPRPSRATAPQSATSSESAASSVSGSTVGKLPQQQMQRRQSTATTPLTSPPAASPLTVSVQDGSIIDPTTNDEVKAEAKRYFGLAARSYMNPEAEEIAWSVLNSMPERFRGKNNARQARRYLNEWRVRRGAHIDAMKDAKQYELVVPDSVAHMMLQDYMRIVHRQQVWSVSKDSKFTVQAILASYKEQLDANTDKSDSAAEQYHELASCMVSDLQHEAKNMCEALYSNRKVNNDTNDEEHSIFILHEVAHMIEVIKKKKPVLDLTILGAPHLVRLIHQMVHYLNVSTDIRDSSADINSGGGLAELQFEHLQAIVNFIDEPSGIAREVLSQKDKLYADRTRTSTDKTDVKIRQLFYHSEQLPIDAVHDAGANCGDSQPPSLKGVIYLKNESMAVDDEDEKSQARIKSCFGANAAEEDDDLLFDDNRANKRQRVHMNDGASKTTTDSETLVSG